MPFQILLFEIRAGFKLEIAFSGRLSTRNPRWYSLSWKVREVLGNQVKYLTKKAANTQIRCFFNIVWLNLLNLFFFGICCGYDSDE